MSIQSSGFIVTGQDAIWGFGATETEAWNDFKRGMKAANVEIVDSVPEDGSGSYAIESDYEVEAATQALIDSVQASGGDISWSKIGVVCCTDEEFLTTGQN